MYDTAGGDDTDNLYGGSARKRDYLNAADGDGLDTLNGGKGRDTCVGDPGDEFISCSNVTKVDNATANSEE